MYNSKVRIEVSWRIKSSAHLTTAHFSGYTVSLQIWVDLCALSLHASVCVCVCVWVCVCRGWLGGCRPDLKSRGMQGANSRRSAGRQRRRNVQRAPVSRTDSNLYSLKDPDNPLCSSPTAPHPLLLTHCSSPTTPELLTHCSSPTTHCSSPTLSRLSSGSARSPRRLSFDAHDFVLT